MNIENLPTIAPDSISERLDPDYPILLSRREFRQPLRVAAHSHPRGQLMCGIRGVFRVLTEQGTWIVPASQAVWIPPALPHELVAMAPVSLRNLFLDPSVCQRLADSCQVLDVTPLLRELVLRLLQLGNDYPLQSPAQRLVAVMLDEIQALQPTRLHLPMARDKRLQRIQNALIAAPADERGLEDWAQFVGASSRTLARLFERDTGMGFGEWRQQLRLLEAIDRLHQGQPVTQVALDLGYQSSSAFISMFRRALGVPPGRYLRHAHAEM